ncbi:MAG TPA: histidine phosphatase family protein [Ktedonobacterales bacterium]|jgi:broad specificity phosphatase PhoE|nr:histidine phosphatase family protein [Ktedonobacterales bacterium]
MLTIYYSPHATSLDNEAGRASGHADVPLSDRGRQGALAVARQYLAIPMDAAYCSDLRRAADTAASLIADRATPLIPDMRLREFDYGTMTQWARERVEAEFPLRITTPFPGGESMLTVVERVGSFLRDALATHDGKTVVVIGHRGTKWGFDYWAGSQSLEEIARTPWEWREIPIWRYALESSDLARREPIVIRAPAD